MKKTNSADFYLVDLHYLKEITEDTPASMLEIIDVFVKVVPLELKQIRRLITKQAAGEFEIAIHKLKPKFHYVGVTALDACLAALEEKVGERDWMACQRVFEEAEYTTNAVILELHKVKNNMHLSLQPMV